MFEVMYTALYCEVMIVKTIGSVNEIPYKELNEHPKSIVHPSARGRFRKWMKHSLL